MKRFFDKPQNIRIIRENAIASLIVFLLLGFVEPFRVDELDDTRFLYFTFIAATIFVMGCLTGFFTCYVLKMPLDPNLPLRTVHRNSLFIYLIHLPISAAIIMTTFGFMYCDHVADIWWQEGHVNWPLYFQSLYYVVSLGAFVFLGTFIRNRNWHLHCQLEEMRTINALLEKNQKTTEDIDPSVSPAAAPDSRRGDKAISIAATNEEGICRLEGDRANSLMEVLPSNIIYVESMSNYADVCYLDNDRPSHRMLRITLKQVTAALEAVPFLAQCHRAYIVNLNFVVAMTSRSNGYQLQVFGTDKLIPVSRSFTPEIKEKLQKAK